MSVVALFWAWMWSRGARDPRTWPTRVPQEATSLKRALDDALAAGRRASDVERREFDDELRRARSTARRV